MMSPLTIKQALLHSQHTLHTSQTPVIDAQVLVMCCCGLSRNELITQVNQALSPEQTKHLNTLLEQRQAGTPIAYLLGHKEFWSMKLTVNRSTLIPRPETETLVEQALALIASHTALTIVDLGTGCGAIALAIAKLRPDCRLIATDLSAGALAIAKGNSAQHRINNIEFRVGHWLQPLGSDKADFIISNPPYIAADDPCLLQSDLNYEPRSALEGGVDGLAAITAIIQSAKSYLKPLGYLILEHGNTQAQAIQSMMLTAGYQHIRCYPDLAGHDRVSLCQRPQDC